MAQHQEEPTIQQQIAANLKEDVSTLGDEALRAKYDERGELLQRTFATAGTTIGQKDTLIDEKEAEIAQLKLHNQQASALAQTTKQEHDDATAGLNTQIAALRKALQEQNITEHPTHVTALSDLATSQAAEAARSRNANTNYNNEVLRTRAILLSVAVVVTLAAAAVLAATLAPQHMPDVIAGVVGGLTPVAYNAIFGATIAAGALGIAATAGLSFYVNKSRDKATEIANASEAELLAMEDPYAPKVTATK